MGGFSELVKNFDKTRDYIRDFFIYGFKVRGDFEKKSLRTYDDEKRRVESWLGDYMKYDNSVRGKKVSIAVDSGSISENPLYQAYYSKSFTTNDIKLHFFITDVLHNGESLTLNEIADRIGEDYGEIFEVQTIRNKLREYTEEGIILTIKKGKTAYFRLSEDTIKDFLDSFDGLTEAVEFFSETSRFGIIGNSILKSAGLKNELFVIKHNYIVHTLEDIVIPDILSAIEQKRYISAESFRKKNDENLNNVIPMQIFTSVQTGRRYLAGYITVRKRFTALRLDFIKKVTAGAVCDRYDSIYDRFMYEKNYCFGVSFGSWEKCPEPETLIIDFIIDEKTESFVTDRLEREKRNGVLEKKGVNSFRLTFRTYDSYEVLQWARTFTGRITSVRGDNTSAIKRFYNDVFRMNNLYKDDENENIS